MLKILIIVFAVFSIIGLQSIFAAEVNFTCDNNAYPWCNNTSEIGGSSGLVARFYNIALALVGATAFGAFVFGAIKYTLSEGNPGKMQDALAWIWGAVWGVVLLFGGYLLLNTINPEIVSLESPNIEGVTITTSSTSTTETSSQSTVSTCSSSTGICSITQQSMTYESCQSWAENIKSQNNLTELPTITFSDQQTDGTGICKLVYTKK